VKGEGGEEEEKGEVEIEEMTYTRNKGGRCREKRRRWGGE
jgi:hypothetical protein